MTLKEIRAEDAAYEDDDDVRALVYVAPDIGAEAVKHRRYLLTLVDELAGALRDIDGWIKARTAHWKATGSTDKDHTLSVMEYRLRDRADVVLARLDAEDAHG